MFLQFIEISILLIEKGGECSMLKLHEDEVIATNFHLQCDFPRLDTSALALSYSEYIEVNPRHCLAIHTVAIMAEK